MNNHNYIHLPFRSSGLYNISCKPKKRRDQIFVSFKKKKNEKMRIL